jgi:hypothetical protein
MTSKIRFLVTLVIIVALPTNSVLAQNLDSTNYTLIQPVVGEPLNGTIESTNYSDLLNSSPVSSYTSTSTTYNITGGTARAIEANVPAILCFETSTNSGSTTCAGAPGGNGMQGVCSQPGCYDRAKLEIDVQGNPTDTRYAIQISTSPTFVSIFYVDATTRFMKSNVTIADYIPKCEWEGIVVSGICGSPNTTWQRYNILGLNPNTTYYVRLAAQHGSATNASFTESTWGPSASATTSDPSITLDVDIAPNTSTPTTPPYILNLGTITPSIVNTSTDMIIFRLTSNSISGISTLIRGLNGGMQHVTEPDIINSANTDLTAVGSGYGLRNDSATNSALNTGTLGSVNVSTTPSDFSDTAPAEKVGQVPTTLVELFDSGGAPLNTGVTGYKVKVKPSSTHASGNYRETLTFITVGVF